MYFNRGIQDVQSYIVLFNVPTIHHFMMISSGIYIFPNFI